MLRQQIGGCCPVCRRLWGSQIQAFHEARCDLSYSLPDWLLRAPMHEPALREGCPWRGFVQIGEVLAL